MKVRGLFLSVLAVLGVLSGADVSAILLAISAPSMNPYLLTLQERADFERIARYSSMVSGSFQLTLHVIVIVLGIVAIALFLAVINPRIMKGVPGWRSKAGVRLLVCIMAVIGWLVVMFAAFSGTSGPYLMRMLGQWLVVIVATALLWLLAGETGWAGDFSASTWALPASGSVRRSLLLGAAAGLILCSLEQLAEWVQGNYFVLVSEVLDRSGETSFLGLKLLSAGIIVMLFVMLPLLGGFIVALAPAHRAGDDIKRSLKYPAIAAALFCGAILLAWWYAGRTYDLNKKDLAAHLGISAAGSKARTIVILKPTKEQPVIVRQWPLKVSGYALSLKTTVPVTEENLGKVEAYLAAHPRGSVYTYAGREILAKGYLALWDMKIGLAWQAAAAQSQLVPRSLLLARLRSLPVTDEHLRLLESLSDEKRWSPGVKAALALARAYQHFGKTDDAKRWLDKAKAAGAEGAAADILDMAVVLDGSIRGRLLINGSAPKDARAALISSPEDIKQELTEITEFSLGKVLVDSCTLGPEGSFEFTGLGSGSYLVAIMLPADQVPSTVLPGTLTARFVPGYVRIGPESSRDLGTIEIGYKP